MSDEQLAALARQIVEGELLSNWRFHLVLLAVVFVAVAASSFVVGYFRTRGTRYATKADFDQLLHELRETTKTTEEIKQSISHDVWIERELRVTRRQKLEELLRAVYELHLWLDREKDHALFDGPPNELPDPTYKLEIVGGLYFDELANELNAFKLAALNYKKWLIGHKAEVVKARLVNDNAAKLAAVSEATNGFTEVYQRLLAATGKLEGSAKALMVETLGATANNRMQRTRYG